MSGAAGVVPDSYDLTVITVTRGRPGHLRSVLENVRDQDYRHRLIHQIVVDDDEPAYRALAERTAAEPMPATRAVGWRFEPRAPGTISGPGVLGPLRNRAVARATTPLVAFVDDDNVLDRHHYSSLLHCMIKTGCAAVHSQRCLVHADGQPYLARLSPWKRDIPAARSRYLELARHHVYLPWSNIVRDQVHPRDQADRIQMVDTSEWLFTRQQAMATPFGERFSGEDWTNVVGEDNKLLKALVDDDVPVAGTHLPTLTYVLGGYSNAFTSEKEGVW